MTAEPSRQTGRLAPTVVSAAPDAPEAAALLEAHAREMRRRYPEGGWPGVATSFGSFWLAWCDGRPVGCVGLRALAEDVIEVKHLYVEPGARRRGVAAALMGTAEAVADRRGAAVVLETGSRQPEAIALYERRGYRRRGPYPGCDIEDERSVYLERPAHRGPMIRAAV